MVLAVVVAALVAGGGAFAAVTLLTGKHHSPGAQSSGTPTVHAPQSHSAPATPAQSSSSTATSSPTASKPASPSVSPSPSGVAVAPGVNNPAEAGVVAYLNSYFTAINSHDYTAYNNLLVPSLQANDSQSTFNSGFGTTKDKAETLTSIADTGGGGEAATVKFTSNQSLADSASNSTCTHWTITLYLQPNGSGYLDGPAPAGYHAAFAAC